MTGKRNEHDQNLNMKPAYHPRKLLILGLASINILVLALSGYSLFKSQQQYELRAQILTQNISSAVDQNVSSTIEKIDVALSSVVELINNQKVKNIDKQAVNELLDRLVKRMPEVEGIRVINRNGLIILGNGVTKVVNVSDRDHFIYHRDNANETLRISKPLWGRIVNHYILVFSRRFNNPGGSFAGVVYATVTLDHFNKLLSRFNLGPDDAIVLRDSDLGLLARHPDISPKSAGMVGNSTVSREFRRLAETGVGVATYHTSTSADGLERTFSFRRLKNAPFIVLVGLASKDYMSDWNKEVYEMLAINLSLFLLTLLSGYSLLKSFSEVEKSAERLNEAQRIAHVGSWTLDVGTGKLLLSDEIFRMFEVDPGKFDGTYEAFINFIHHEDREAVRTTFTESLAQQTAFEINHRLLMPDGRIKWVQQRVTSDFDSEGKPIRSQGTFLDITERKRAEDNLRITASVFDISQEAITITDAKNSIIDVNPAFTRITGYSREEVIGKNPRFLSSGRQEKAFYAAMWQSLNKDRAWSGELWNRRKSGEIYPELISISVLCDEDDKVLRYVAVFSDISHIKNHENELRRVAHFDSLTGIPNRVLLADRIKHAISQTSRDHNMMAVCYLDLDGFKPINDTLGHKAGDEVLIEVAKRIGHTIRGGDTVARLGGDEFVILLLGLEMAEECVATLERLLEAIAQPITLGNKSNSISASIGVSIYPLDEEDPDTLLRHADQAMYIAKQSGKNRFYIYDSALDRRARDQHDFLKSIRHGLEHNQFELYYQPKVNLRTRELVGAEALIRWRHPERGLLSPAEFLSFIENTDLDIEIGEWVIATALAQVDQWVNTGMDIEVSINISGYHLESRDFTERLQQQVANYPDMPFGKFQIEVLETVALNDMAIVQGIIESCRKIGVGFALDDFGTGYSSLSYLSDLPVDTLKIDQSFVRDMLEDKGDMAIVQGIIDLARAFDRQTVAEGIETDDHYNVLLEMGCELGQGYGIAHPMPASELAIWQSNSRLQAS